GAASATASARKQASSVSECPGSSSGAEARVPCTLESPPSSSASEFSCRSATSKVRVPCMLESSPSSSVSEFRVPSVVWKARVPCGLEPSLGGPAALSSLPEYLRATSARWYPAAPGSSKYAPTRVSSFKPASSTPMAESPSTTPRPPCATLGKDESASNGRRTSATWNSVNPGPPTGTKATSPAPQENARLRGALPGKAETRSIAKPPETRSS